MLVSMLKVQLQDKPRAGTAIGDYVVDLNVLAQYGLFEEVGCDNSLDNVFAQVIRNIYPLFSLQNAS